MLCISVRSFLILSFHLRVDFPSRIDGTSADPKGNGDLIRQEFWLGPVDRLGGSRKAGDPHSNPGPGENFSLKLTISYNILYEKVGNSLSVW